MVKNINNALLLWSRSGAAKFTGLTMQAASNGNSRWSSRWVFFFAATGAAVGLSNIWTFPYVVAQGGGVLFLAIYLLCMLLMGVPIMLCEVVQGHLGRASLVTALRTTVSRSGRSRRWTWIGPMGPLAGFVIFALLSVIAAQAGYYLVSIFSGDLLGIGLSQLQQTFSNLQQDPQTLFVYQSAFVALVLVILSLGPVRGIQPALLYLVPLLLVMLLVLLAMVANLGQLSSAWQQLFYFDPNALTLDMVLAAMGHAFFSLSVGTGALVIYGAYMPSKGAIGAIVVGVALFDTLVAILSGLLVLGLLAGVGESAAGYQLLFVSLPMAFADMAGGQWVGGLFFSFIAFAALSSAISLLEPSIAWLIEYTGISRLCATILVGFAAWLLGILCFGSYSFLGDVRFMGETGFDLLNFASASVLVPLGGLFLAIYSGWVMNSNLVRREIAHSGMFWLYLWYFLVRYVVPSAVAAIFVLNLINEFID